MGIPEHSKYVKMKKKLRHIKKYGDWRYVRKILRSMGLLKNKERFREELRAEFMMHKNRLRLYGVRKSRYHKYDD